MIRSYQTVTALLTVLMLVWSPMAWALGQGGTGKEPTTPKRSTPEVTSPARKTTSPKRTAATPRQSACSADPPTAGTGVGRTVNLNGVIFEMVEIPVGSFCMGSKDGRFGEQPVHKVTIRQPFYLGKYEITQAQWQAVMGNNPSAFKDCGVNCPVDSLSWNDTQNFINKLNQSNDVLTFRLPTEAEWEYACRAGTTADHAGNVSEMAWYADNAGGRSHPVGQRQPNPWGLFDMHGNVLEWCQDWYHRTYHGAPVDGRAWLTGGEQKNRVLRGGSWVDGEWIIRSAYRNPFPPDLGGNGPAGLRVVAVARNN